MTVTPISMAVMMATVANGGTRVTPHLLKAVNLDGTLTPYPPPEPRSVVSLSPTTLNASGMASGMSSTAPGLAHGHASRDET